MTWPTGELYVAIRRPFQQNRWPIAGNAYMRSFEDEATALTRTVICRHG